MALLSQYYPVKLHNQWRSEVPVNLSPVLIDWLLDPSSLTARLKRHCQQFSVALVGQQVVEHHESVAGNLITQGEPVIAREVVLYCDHVPQVFARSLLPTRTLTGELTKLSELGTQPLGQVLFNDPKLKRTCIEVAEFDQNSSVMKLANSLNLASNHNLWGRRSLFSIEDKPIAVAEVFLPGAFAYAEVNQYD